ncbi:MAG: glycosyltransferase family 2 protein [Proteobacteria bacterium]|uniref:glycosyltransferase family 2 protein n=1 Tax=Aquabacterium sp. TaxID=1872578 RepID=UPI0035C736C3|nr:glycosyltransferase family 2 protein [Pseudomonadota bacterium]
MSAPVISVVIPVYNAAHFVGETIDSVLAQSQSGVELIVVDDGSEDHLAEVMLRYPQVTFLRQDNRGVSSARNLGARHARGTWLAFVDSDDVWHRHKLRDQLRLAELHPDVPLGTSLSQAQSKDALDFEPSMDHGTPPCLLYPGFREVFLSPYLGLSRVFLRRDDFLAVGGFDESLRYAEDIDFYLRFLVGRGGYWQLGYEAVYARPVEGSLSSDSVSGYEQILFVYRRFLSQHPSFAQVNRLTVKEAFAFLYLRYAGSLLRARRSRVQVVTMACRAFCSKPSLAASVLALRAVLPRGWVETLRSVLLEKRYSRTRL